MSVRFASARNAVRPFGWHATGRGIVCRAQALAANDNGAAARRITGFDPLLTEALRHFAVHGLAAAETALIEAEEARMRRDAEAKAHWLAITGMFDRRLAATATRDLSPA